MYDDPRVLTFIFDLVPVEGSFCTCVTKADFSHIRKCPRLKSCGTYLVLCNLQSTVTTMKLSHRASCKYRTSKERCLVFETLSALVMCRSTFDFVHMCWNILSFLQMSKHYRLSTQSCQIALGCPHNHVRALSVVRTITSERSWFRLHVSEHSCFALQVLEEYLKSFQVGPEAERDGKVYHFIPFCIPLHSFCIPLHSILLHFYIFLFGVIT